MVYMYTTAIVCTQRGQLFNSHFVVFYSISIDVIQACVSFCIESQKLLEAICIFDDAHVWSAEVNTYNEFDACYLDVRLLRVNRM